MVTEQTKQYAFLEEPTISIDEFCWRATVAYIEAGHVGRHHFHRRIKELACELFGHEIDNDTSGVKPDYCLWCEQVVDRLVGERK